MYPVPRRNDVAQQEFDEMPGIVVHLIREVNGRVYAECSGKEIDPSRWIDDARSVRKQCQACFALANRRAISPFPDLCPPSEEM